MNRIRRTLAEQLGIDALCAWHCTMCVSPVVPSETAPCATRSRSTSGHHREAEQDAWSIFTRSRAKCSRTTFAPPPQNERDAFSLRPCCAPADQLDSLDARRRVRAWATLVSLRAARESTRHPSPAAESGDSRAPFFPATPTPGRSIPSLCPATSAADGRSCDLARGDAESCGSAELAASGARFCDLVPVSVSVATSRH